MGFFETHREFFRPVEGEEHYVRPPANLPDTVETRADMASFVASARSLDRGVGAVLDALEDTGLARTTLVICTTDHGIAFPGAKATMSDRGTGVMLILRGPGGFGAGKLSDALVSHIDLYPTVCDLLEIPHPDWLQGRSLMPIVTGAADEVRDAIFTEGTYHAAYEPQRAVRTQRWKLVRRFGDRRLPVLPNIDDSPSKDVWLRHGYAERELPPLALHDLVFDPNEAENLVAHVDLAPVVDDLSTRLERWMRDTGDPLLHGPVAPPPGAEVNDPDQRSAADPVHVC